MTYFNPTDPAAEIAYLKALEKAKWPEPAELKKKEWGKATAEAKAKEWTAPTTPRKWRNWTPDTAAEATSSILFHPRGIPWPELMRVALIAGAMIAAALAID